MVKDIIKKYKKIIFVKRKNIKKLLMEKRKLTNIFVY